MKIGIVGAGVVGMTLAKLAVRAGHQVMLSNSRGPQTLFSLRSLIGCETGSADEAARYGEIAVIAVPLSAIRQLPAVSLRGKRVVDTVNYYPERDGIIASLEASQTTTSELLAQALPDARITKAFNAIRMPDLESNSLPPGMPDRQALPLAGDYAADEFKVTELYNIFGFDVVDAGALSEGWRFERDMPCYCQRMTRSKLCDALATAKRNAQRP